MKYLLITLLVFTASFSKSDYYTVISGEDKKAIDAMLVKLDVRNATHDQKAYRGALLMKKAGYEKTPKEKLALFKEGKTILEKEIALDKDNTEYRFLRLIIQENAPKILKYNTNLSEDVAWIKKNYTGLSASIRSAVIAYASNSENLNL